MLRKLLLLSVAGAVPLFAQGGDTTTRQGVYLTLEYNAGGRPGIAVLPVSGATGDSVRAIIQRDLDYSDRIEIVGQAADMLPPVSGTPNFELFSKLRISGIVQATLTADGLHVRLYDVGKQTNAVRGFTLSGAALSREWRMSVHAASDEIERWVTGVRGISATRIAFSREGKVWVADHDGAFPTVVAPEGGMSAAWHPSGRSVAYARLPDVGSSIVMRDLATGSVSTLAGGHRSGTYASPVFSPDGKTLIYAYGTDGFDLFALDLATPGSQKRITTASSNTSPTFSPDGHQIGFTTGRLMQPEVYIADVDGSNAEPLIAGSFGDQSYRADPAWSPDGRSIAFGSRIDGAFQIIVVSSTGKNPKQLTGESENEDPAWAPDGRHIVFTSARGGNSQLWIVDVETFRMRQLTRGSAARSGAWSPHLAVHK